MIPGGSKSDPESQLAALDRLLQGEPLKSWNRKRRTTWVAWVTAAVLVIVGALIPFTQPEPTRFWILFSPYFLATAVALVLLRRGRVKAALVQWVTIICLALSVSLYFAGGLSSQVGIAFAALIALVGVLWHVRAACVVAGFGFLSLLAALIVDEAGYLPPSMIQHTPLHNLIGITAGLVMTLTSVVAGRRLLDLAINEVARSRDRYAALVGQSPDAITFVDDSAIVRFANDATEKLVGYPLAEMLGKRFDQLPFFPEAFRAQALKMFHHLLQDDAPPAAPREAQLIHREGHTITVEVKRQKVYLPGGPTGMQYTIRDVSERHQSQSMRLEYQRRLQEAQRMELIGQLAGGVAHDFNNLLTVVLGQSELLLCQKLDSRTREQVEHIAKAGERARLMTQQLLAVARKQIVAPQRIDPSVAIRGLDHLLAALVGKQIDLIFDLTPDSGAIAIDPGQFDQILTQLVAHARESMPSGGRVTIRSVPVLGAQQDAAPLPTRAQGRNWVLLSIQDEGPGLDAEALSRIFEPFFIAHRTNRLQGMGLAVVDGIVAQNGGFIEVESNPERGTRFDLYFVRADDAQS